MNGKFFSLLQYTFVRQVDHVIVPRSMYMLITVPTHKPELCHQDTQHNDIQLNDTQHNDIQLNDTQHKDTQHNYIQHDDK
jgi:hypothetical protein